MWLDCGSRKWKIFLYGIWMMGRYEQGVVKKSLQILPFLYFRVLLLREKVTRKLGEGEEENKLMATAAQGRIFWLLFLDISPTTSSSHLQYDSQEACLNVIIATRQLPPTLFCIFLYCSKGKPTAAISKETDKGTWSAYWEQLRRCARFHFIVILG